MSKSAKSDIAKMSFEEALSELDRIVSQLESGQAGLEESIEIYERGAALKQHCEEKLKAAQAKIEKIVIAPNGDVSTEAANLS